MCGRYAFNTDTEQFHRHFAIRQSTLVLNSSPEVFPSQQVPVVTLKEENHNTVTLMKWGFVPRWAKTPKPLINARSETAAVLPTFRESYRLRRCLIPATSFFEWRKHGRKSTRYRISLKNRPLFAFAGLWDSWEGIETVCILTIAANAAMLPIHDRMPAIIPSELCNRWLSSETHSEEFSDMLVPYPSEDVEIQVCDKAEGNRSERTLFD